MKNAFTLVELSIVLVIIGLLTAGVVGGQSLIESAKIQSTVSDWTKYKTAYNAFRLEYDGLPGDIKNGYDYFGSTCGTNVIVVNDVNGQSGCNGNGDKKLFFFEGQKAMQHLQLSGIMQSGITIGNVVSPVIVGTNIPKARFDSSGYMFSYASESSSPGFGAMGNANILMLGNPALSNFPIYPRGASLTTKQMKNIDDKADDGVFFRGAISGSDGSINTSGTNATCGNSTTGVYALSTTTIACTGVFKLD